MESLCLDKPHAQIDLSDDQMQLLLLDAESRMGASEPTSDVVSKNNKSIDSSKSQHAIPRYSVFPEYTLLFHHAYM